MSEIPEETKRRLEFFAGMEHQKRQSFEQIKHELLRRIEADLTFAYGCFDVFDRAIDEFEKAIKEAQL